MKMKQVTDSFFLSSCSAMKWTNISFELLYIKKGILNWEELIPTKVALDFKLFLIQISISVHTQKKLKYYFWYFIEFLSYFKQNHNLGDKNVLRGHQLKPWYSRDEGTEVHRVNDSLPISRSQFVGSWDYSFFYFYLTTHYSVKLLLSQQQLRNNYGLLIQVLVR